MAIRIKHPQTQPRKATRPNEFLNPYNFVKTPPRDVDGELGDHAPEGHDTYHEDRYSGSIPIVLTTRTPLLLPDQPNAEAAQGNQPRKVGTRQRGVGGGPLLNGSTIKGVLRSAYEAITNSRYGVISEAHDELLAIRQDPRNMLDRALKPAYVTSGPDENGAYTLFVCDELVHMHCDSDMDPKNPAPWVPLQCGEKLARSFGGLSRLDNQEVDAWIHLQKHPAKGRQAAFTLWRVSDVVKKGDPLPKEPSTPRDDGWTQDVAPIRVSGRLLWNHSKFPATGRQSKHDERLVVTELLDGNESPGDLSSESSICVNATIVEKFQTIVTSFQRAHKHDTQLESKFGTYVTDSDRWMLRKGRTLWVEFESSTSNVVVGLFPALIGRETFAVAPSSLIDAKHRKPEAPECLSPADRVFGWVHPKGGRATGVSAFRGKLRVDPPQAVTTIELTTHPDAKRLGTLNGPKPEQYRFYVGDTDQQPETDGRAKSAAEGYRRTGSGVRGRKFYLPHTETFGDEEYWTPTRSQPRPVGGRTRYKEYLAVDERHPSVQVAVKSWVPAGSTFSSTLWFENLSGVELGALLWILALPDAGVLGVGLGKPLGFGSVRFDADWDNVRIFDHAGLMDRYGSVTVGGQSLSTNAVERLINDFETAIESLNLREVLDQFLDAAVGFAGAPVHYPRIGENGNPGAPQGEMFEWFVQNEYEGRRHSLPVLGDAAKPPTLPYLPKPPPRQQQNPANPQRGHGQRRPGSQGQHRRRS